METRSDDEDRFWWWANVGLGWWGSDLEMKEGIRQQCYDKEDTTMRRVRRWWGIWYDVLIMRMTTMTMNILRWDDDDDDDDDDKDDYNDDDDDKDDCTTTTTMSQRWLWQCVTSDITIIMRGKDVCDNGKDKVYTGRNTTINFMRMGNSSIINSCSSCSCSVSRIISSICLFVCLLV